MSTLAVKGVRLEDIEKHPNADALDIVRIAGYIAIVQKDRFKSGDMAVYIPEQAVVPEELLRASNFWNEEAGKGMLAGPKGDRVKAIKLRGTLSQGIFVVPDFPIEEGADYADELGIVKYSPPIPAHLTGKVFDAGYGNFSFTDIENIKAYPDVIELDEDVVMTEKLHGTCCIFMWRDGQLFVSSKGMAAKGLAIDPGDTHNFYNRIAAKYEIAEKLARLFVEDVQVALSLYAEGLGVQDLKYGTTGADPEARFFDISCIFINSGISSGTEYGDPVSVREYLDELDLPAVPLLYRGPFTQEALETATNGPETLTGKNIHVREGTVVNPVIPRRDDQIGRVILKSVSEKYLLRKGDATEFE